MQLAISGAIVAVCNYTITANMYIRFMIAAQPLQNQSGKAGKLAGRSRKQNGNMTRQFKHGAMGCYDKAILDGERKKTTARYVA